MIYLCNRCLQPIDSLVCEVLAEESENGDGEGSGVLRKFNLSLQEMIVDNTEGEPEMMASVTGAADEDLHKYASLIDETGNWFCPKCGEPLPLYLSVYAYEGEEIHEKDERHDIDEKDGTNGILVIAIGSRNVFERHSAMSIMRAVEGLVEFARYDKDDKDEPVDFRDVFQWEC